MGKTSIGWTDETWNPVTGCSHVSPGCEHCYAEALSLRRGWSKKPWTAQNVAENVVLHPDRLDYPLHWRDPRMAFMSMCDPFHGMIPYDFLDQMFAAMAVSPTHTFQLLTKRSSFMRDYLSQDGIAGAIAAETGSGVSGKRSWPFIRPDDMEWPLPNVWLGVSVEDQRRADERILNLLGTPAAVRWLSCEPLLGPIDLMNWLLMEPPVDWVVVGGESGPGHRPMDPAWLEDIVEQCGGTATPVFVKQDSGHRPGKQGRIPDELWAYKEFPRQHG